MRHHKISIFGLTLTYKEKDGSLVLEEGDFKSAKKTFPAIPSDLKGMRLARIEELVKGKAIKRADPNPTTPPPPPPCKPRWSNAFRVELENVDGKCLHFTAASTGPIKVLFSAKPGNEENRYGVVIEPTMVRMFKVRIDPVKQQLKLLSNKLSNLVLRWQRKRTKNECAFFETPRELYIRLIFQTKASIKQI